MSAMAISETAANNLDFILEKHFRRHSGLGEETILVSYHGNVDATVTDQLLKLSEKAILDQGAKRVQMKKILTVLIEILQNVSLHGASKGEGLMDSFFMLSATKEHFNIYSGNLVYQDEAKGLKARLDALLNLSAEEVKKLYIETLCNEDFSIKGGAGLGFLTVAKKVDEPIRFEFVDYEKGCKYFTLLARIKK